MILKLALFWSLRRHSRVQKPGSIQGFLCCKAQFGCEPHYLSPRTSSLPSPSSISTIPLHPPSSLLALILYRTSPSLLLARCPHCCLPLRSVRRKNTASCRSYVNLASSTHYQQSLFPPVHALLPDLTLSNHYYIADHCSISAFA